MGHTPSTAGTFRKKFRKKSGKTPETLSERFLAFPSRVQLGCPKPYNNSRHLRLPERFQNSLPPSTAGGASFSEVVPERPLCGAATQWKTGRTPKMGKKWEKRGKIRFPIETGEKDGREIPKKWKFAHFSIFSVFFGHFWADPGVLWKKAPRAMRAMRGKTLETVPFQPYFGCTKSFLKVLSN